MIGSWYTRARATLAALTRPRFRRRARRDKGLPIAGRAAFSASTSTSTSTHAFRTGRRNCAHHSPISCLWRSCAYFQAMKVASGMEAPRRRQVGIPADRVLPLLDDGPGSVGGPLLRIRVLARPDTPEGVHAAVVVHRGVMGRARLREMPAPRPVGSPSRRRPVGRPDAGGHRCVESGRADLLEPGLDGRLLLGGQRRQQVLEPDGHGQATSQSSARMSAGLRSRGSEVLNPSSSNGQRTVSLPSSMLQEWNQPGLWTRLPRRMPRSAWSNRKPADQLLVGGQVS
ncbi:hypothetical protein Maq22A_c13565 [Methylobacterium aquaticum]|uniref:Uncharacterized protein n=1 Tax=Methylobacterium aquaticum TaxID=270351 RepID=A0A0C6F047_9HYPH|nr:hypothetical protein Maq22A_c13565 [Methylobacterium aquaticum]